MNKKPEPVLIDARSGGSEKARPRDQGSSRNGKRPDVDAILTIGHGGRSVQYLAEVKKRMTRSLIEHTVGRRSGRAGGFG
jgi:hypothetical protein